MPTQQQSANAEPTSTPIDENADPCHACGNPIAGPDRLYEFNGYDYCADCVITCDDCGHATPENTTYSRGGNTVCGVCCHSYVWSEYESGYIPEGRACDGVDRNGRSITFDRDNGDDFDWCDDCGRYEHVNLTCRASRPTVIHGYHNGPRSQPIRNDWSKRHGNRYFGVELEVECGDDVADIAAERVLGALDSAQCMGVSESRASEVSGLYHCEHDGSLDNGFEIITAPMGLDAHRALWPLLLRRPVIAGLKSHTVTTCGLHVHVSRASLSRLQVAKMNVFLNDSGNAELVRAVARRYHADYCRIKAKSFKSGTAVYGDHGKYDALNVSPRATVEFRVFKGTLKASSVVACIEFAHAAADFCSDWAGMGLMLTASRFLAFIDSPRMHGETKYLRAYLSTRGYAQFTARTRPATGGTV